MKPGHCGPFPYSPIIRRPPLKWRNGAHVALWVVPDIEFFALRVRASGFFNVQTLTGVVQRINVRHCTLVYRSDGYSYRGRASSPRINPAVSGAGKFDTKPVFERLHLTAGEFGEMICRQFDVRYRERRRVRPHHGDHDQSVSDGTADRIDAFDAALRRISQRQTVWKATGTEIARHYRTQSGRD